MVNGKPQFASPVFNSYYTRLFEFQKIVDPITQILSAAIHYGTHIAAQRQSISSAEKNSLHIGLPIPGAHAFSLLNIVYTNLQSIYNL